MTTVKNSLPELSRVGAYLWHWAETEPDRQVMSLGEQRFTCAELAEEVRRCAAALMAAGVRAGDRVAMLATPGPEFMVTLLATTEIGAIWLGLNPRYRMREFQHVIGETRPRVLIAMTEVDGRRYDEELLGLTAEFNEISTLVIIGPALSATSVTTVAYSDFLSSASPDEAALAARQKAIALEDTAVIIFTSGSTGAPKGAMIRHRGLITGALMENRRWPSKTRPCVLHNFPINHIAGLGMTGLFPLIVGGSLVFMARFDARTALELIEQEKVTFWLQAPTMFQMVLSHPEFEEFDISSIEYIIWAGSAAPKSLIAKLFELDAVLATAFGMTELSLYATFSDLDAGLDVLSWTIGKPERSFDIRVADEANNPVPAGDQGEIQARGDWLMAGYYNATEATAEAFTSDGWFKTGDVAKVYADGNLEIVGRLKEMYISGTYNIFPREIEIVIESHPNVVAASVIGVPNEMFGEVGHAVVEPVPGAEPGLEELDAWCRERLANYKVPKQFELIDELPKLAIGKIDKQALKQRLSG